MNANNVPYGDPALKMPTFARNADPAFVRSQFQHYSRLRDLALEIRDEWERKGYSIEDRWGAACVILWATDAAEACQDWLRKTARRGGRGLPVAAPGIAQEGIASA